jgi:hypothetical protein
MSWSDLSREKLRNRKGGEGMKSYICPQCHQVVNYDESADPFEQAAKHLETCSGAKLEKRYPRITDVVPPAVMKGNLITIEELLGKEVLITGLDWKESTFKEDTDYLSLTVEVDGEEKVLNTGAQRVVAVFKEVKLEDLPIYAAFDKITLPGGKRVYIVK